MPKGTYERTENQKNKLRKLFKGHKHSEETKIKIGESSSKNLKYKTKQNEIIRLYIKEKKSTIEISKIFKIHSSVIWKYLRRNGIKLRSVSEATRYNGIWKGDNVGYSGVHAWVKKHKPKPRFCEICKKRPPYDLANISGEYKRDIKDFEWICRKCHMEKDKRMENLEKGRLKESKLQ